MEPGELPKPQEPVKLNQKFQPFDPSREIKNPHGNKTGGPVLFFETKLETPFGEIPFTFVLINNNAIGSIKKIDSVVPFDPDAGYIITSDDFDATSRANKINNMRQELNQIVDPQRAPLELYFHARLLDDHNNQPKDFADSNGSNFIENYRPYISHLKLLLEFPDGKKYSALNSCEDGSYFFANRFVPFEATHLPIPFPIPKPFYVHLPKPEHLDPLDIYQGFTMLLPKPPQLNQVNAMFMRQTEEKMPGKTRNEERLEATKLFHQTRPK